MLNKNVKRHSTKCFLFIFLLQRNMAFPLSRIYAEIAFIREQLEKSKIDARVLPAPNANGQIIIAGPSYDAVMHHDAVVSSECIGRIRFQQEQ